jgi:hypothetical protein
MEISHFASLFKIHHVLHLRLVVYLPLLLLMLLIPSVVLLISSLVLLVLWFLGWKVI